MLNQVIITDDVRFVITSPDTCNCHHSLYTNWWLNPPYVDEIRPGSNSTGIMPPIITSAVRMCCGNCSEYGTTIVNFTSTALKTAAQKQGLVEFRQSFDEVTEFNFPVYGLMEQTQYLDNYGFVPLVQSGGVALIIIGDEEGTASKVLIASIITCWPILFLCGVFLWLFSTVIWITVRSTSDIFVF